MDEPSAGLSPKVAEEVLTFTKSLTKQEVTIILVEQNVKQALAVADHVTSWLRVEINSTIPQKMIGNPLISKFLWAGRGSKLMIQHLLDGILVGSILSLGAIGLTLVMHTLRFANFSHAELLS